MKRGTHSLSSAGRFFGPVLALEYFPKDMPAPVAGMVGGQFFVDHGALLDYSAKKRWLKE